MEWNRAKQSIHTHIIFWRHVMWELSAYESVASCELMCGGSVNYTNKLTQKWTNEMYKFHKTVMDSTRMRTYSFILKRRIALHEFNEIAIESFVDAFCPYFWTFGMFFFFICVFGRSECFACVSNKRHHCLSVYAMLSVLSVCLCVVRSNVFSMKNVFEQNFNVTFTCRV